MENKNFFKLFFNIIYSITIIAFIITLYAELYIHKNTNKQLLFVISFLTISNAIYNTLNSINSIFNIAPSIKNFSDKNIKIFFLNINELNSLLIQAVQIEDYRLAHSLKKIIKIKSFLNKFFLLIISSSFFILLKILKS